MEPARAELRSAGGRAADPTRAAERGRGSVALTSTDTDANADADDQQHSPARPRRTYRSPRRAEQAAATRAAILASAHELFVANGYAATTVADIARRARVAVDTVYATVGKKPDVLREVLETAISGSDVAVPAEQRDYVLRVRQATTADAKIRAYVDGLIALQPRLAPVVLALRDAAGTDPESAAQWQRIADRRAQNMRQFAADLRATGELREDLTDDDVADIVWSMNGPEYWTLLVGERGWTAERFGDHVVDAWQRILLAAPRSSRASRG
ncbi:TetR/AcrR family transcriptional regulator [Microlunatus ginsengisoli]|uniref:HTH tetR-type domain-containing protein n=1 Tax=Microlunatus ginsengisoli TaxID=363863 RepID=A0ABP7AH79_9ACTN